MFGSLTGLKNQQGTDWGEKLLNNVASTTIRHLFTASESVEVQVRCFPSSKLLQGSIDSFKMSGTGLVIRRDFRVEEMSFETDAVSIDFSSVLGGQLRLKQPTQAIAQVVLTQADLNRSFEAELVKKKLENLSIPALDEIFEGETVSFTQIKVQLLENNRVRIDSEVVTGKGKTVPVSLTSTISVERRRRISFTEQQFEAEAIPESFRDISQTLTEALGEILNNMVDLDKFDLDGVTLRINRLETQGETLVFSGYAQIEDIPKNAKSGN
ncbi:LmeA family phospholipid-binding protein [Merismopedia glauca]|uniref:DUF2993 domain-containing protein n=1 Tax=Merismopedia glauca CCAP 1448/3 TaxID=1296344 RepID=A0A2T1C5V1_9CYAN|nr:DUF2993 domain-containing protein [Merismopedia glauca]PSB03662.1 DUF2993 domain-containing protein [Merismopedia glauca CCAP 1448/3]